MSEYLPKHRKCTRPGHHAWKYECTFSGWWVATCVMCGKTDLT